MKPLRGAGSLLHQIKHDGRKIGVATDCSRSELTHYLRIAGLTKLVDRAACGDDARRGKPHADLLKLALERLRAKPAASLFIGDTPSDAEAARKWGVAAIGLLTGGFRRCDLKAAGWAVFGYRTLGRALKSGYPREPQPRCVFWEIISQRMALMGLFSKDIQTMDDLFLHGLQDIYYAENQIVKSLPKLIEKATNRDLSKGLRDHLEETRNQIARLDQVFKKLGQEPKGVKCPAIDGLISEADELAGEVEDKDVTGRCHRGLGASRRAL